MFQRENIGRSPLHSESLGMYAPSPRLEGSSSYSPLTPPGSSSYSPLTPLGSMSASSTVKSLLKQEFPCGHGRWANYGSKENASHCAFCEQLEYLRQFQALPTKVVGWRCLLHQNRSRNLNITQLEALRSTQRALVEN